MLQSLVLLSFVLGVPNAQGSSPDPGVRAAIEQAVKAIGGESKILRLFQIKERLNVSADPAKKGNERTSVLEPPGHWWLGKNDRVVTEKEPATFLVWAWTLGILTDPASKVEKIADILDNDTPAYGLRVSGSVKPAMDLYFSKSEHLLIRIDWRSDIHRFSDWRQVDGVRYPAKCVGYKKSSGKQWYNTEILDLQRLQQLPPTLKR